MLTDTLRRPRVAAVAGTPWAVSGVLLAAGRPGLKAAGPCLGRIRAGPPHLSRRRCSLLFTHFKRQQVRKAMDMSRMMAQLTMEAMTATLKPKVSWAITAARDKTSLWTWLTQA